MHLSLCKLICCVVQRVLLQTVMTVEVVSASVLHAVLATIAVQQLCAQVRSFLLLYSVTLSIYNHIKHKMP